MKVWVFALMGCVGAYVVMAQMRQDQPLVPAFENQTDVADVVTSMALNVSEFAGPLNRPWGIALTPQDGYIVTERAGTMRVVSPLGEMSEPLDGLPEVFVSGQGGLLDVAVGPDFDDNRLVYFSYAKEASEGLSVTAVARGTLSQDGSALTGVEQIFEQMPPAPADRHFGSRIVFDGEGHVFITLGDRGDQDLAQHMDVTHGKIVRLFADGSVPPDNPFVGRDGLDAIWTLGHRNVQGAMLHPQTGQLWTMEHGPRGGDELNAPVGGLNYGWPVISYGVNYSGTPVGDGIGQLDGLEQPVYFWDPVIAPGDMIVYQGNAFPEWQGDFLIGSLSPGGVVRLVVENDQVVAEERLFEDIGRVRDIQETPEGHLLLLIDAEDGAILRVTPGE